MLPEVIKAHEDDEPVDLAVPVTDMLTARHLLIELAVNARKQEQLKVTLASITGEYRDRIATLAEREALVRQSLLNYAQTYGGTSFPDVGGFSIRRTTAKPKIADEDAVAQWLEAANHHDLYERVEVVEIDKGAALALAAEVLAAHGELPPGFNLSVESESLTVRGLS